MIANQTSNMRNHYSEHRAIIIFQKLRIACKQFILLEVGRDGGEGSGPAKSIAESEGILRENDEMFSFSRRCYNAFCLRIENGGHTEKRKMLLSFMWSKVEDFQIWENTVINLQPPRIMWCYK